MPRLTRSPHLRLPMIAVVAAGGAVGTAAREAVSLAVPPAGALPVAILAVNLVGAFVLGVLLEALQRRGPDEGGRRLLRLAAGTGFCGGFTTYSTLAVGAAALLRTGPAVLGAAYGAGSVLLGVAVAWLGILVGTAIGGRR